MQYTLLVYCIFASAIAQYVSACSSQARTKGTDISISEISPQRNTTAFVSTERNGNASKPLRAFHPFRNTTSRLTRATTTIAKVEITETSESTVKISTTVSTTSDDDQSEGINHTLRNEEQNTTKLLQEVNISEGGTNNIERVSDTLDYNDPTGKTQSKTQLVTNLTVSEIEKIASLLLNMSNNDNPTEASESIELVDQVLQTDNATLIEAQKNRTTCTCFLLGLENLLTKFNSTTLPSKSSQFWTGTINLTNITSLAFQGQSNQKNTSHNFSGTSFLPNPSTFPTTDQSHVIVTLNISALQASRPEARQMAFVYHPSVRLADAALAAGPTTISLYNSTGGTQHIPSAGFTANCTSVAGLVQISVPGGPVKHLASPVKLYFKSPLSLNSSSKVTTYCVYWDPYIQVDIGTGAWSTYGCQYRGMQNGLIHCECTHFSAFTALFAYNDHEKRTIDDEVLDWVTNIGCSLSIMGMACVIFTYIFIPQYRKIRSGFYGHHLIFHLSVALTTLLITFLAGFERTGKPVKCLGIAMLLHYFTLVVFFWMLVESYYYYTLFIRERPIKTKHFLRKMASFAWGIPLLIVLATVSFDTELYFYADTSKYCWLKRRGFLYAVLPFVFAILLVNTTVYVLIMWKVGCARRKRTKSGHIGNPTTLSGYSIVVMFFLLGLSWIFGLLAIGLLRTVFSYLFCIFNSLQGFVIFPLFLYHAKAGRK